MTGFHIFNFRITDEIRKEVIDEINANLYPKSSVHVVFSKLKVGDGMIEFMNEIGDQGWDTSGQLPSTNSTVPLRKIFYNDEKENSLIHSV